MTLRQWGAGAAGRAARTGRARQQGALAPAQGSRAQLPAASAFRASANASDDLVKSEDVPSLFFIRGVFRVM